MTDNMMRRKSNGGLYALIVILLLAVLGLGGYILYNEFLVKEETQPAAPAPVEDEPEKEVLQIDGSKLIDKLMDNSLIYLTNCNFLETFTNDSKVEAKDISNMVAYHMAEAEFKDVTTVTLDEMKSVIAKYLGKDYSFDPTTIDYKGQSCPMFSYDSATQTFTKQEAPCGGTCGPRTSYQLQSTYVLGNTVTVNVKVVFTDSDGTAYFGDYAKTNKLGDAYDSITDLEFSKGSDYKFTFELENDNYVFVSAEPVK